MMNINLINGECLEVMADLPDNSVDVVVCDVPYGVVDCDWDSVIPLDKMWDELLRVTRPAAAIVFTAQQPFTTDLINSNRKMFKYCWVWDKMGTTGFLSAKYRPMSAHEDIVVFVKPKGKAAVKYNPQMEKRDKAYTDNNLTRKFGDNFTKAKGENYDGNSPTYNPQMEKLDKADVRDRTKDNTEGVNIGDLYGGEAPTYNPQMEKRDTSINRVGGGICELHGGDKAPTYNPQMEKLDKPVTAGLNPTPGEGELYDTDMRTEEQKSSAKPKRIIKTYTHRHPKTIVSIKKPGNQGRFHPTQKPVELMEYLIKTYSNEGDTVLDFTMGSGSTGVAAVKCKRSFIGIELDEKYFKICEERINGADVEEKHVESLLGF